MDFLKCPLCGSEFAGVADSLKCRNNHTYDIAKKGYLNLFNGQTKIVKTYGRNLFEARKIISDAGLYGRLTEKLCEIINNTNGFYPILDAGCGCGNLTVDIFNICAKINRRLTVAVDLSKDGIDFASGNFSGEDLIWIVGNLNNLPLSDCKFGIILNVMSPANYAEFKRVMLPDGVLLKVMPDADYLKELRRFIYRENDKNEYSNKDVLSNLEENSKNLFMSISDIINVKYTHAVGKADVRALFDMTPLTLNIDERERVKDELTDSLNDGGKFMVTLAFKIAVCKNKI